MCEGRTLCRVTAKLYGNWIDGRWRASESGAFFEVGERVGTLERWARSSATDVDAAFRSATNGAPRWSRLKRAERVDLLRRVPSALDLDVLEPALARDLGLETGELRERLELELFRFGEAIEIVAEGADQTGVGLFQAHWSDLVGGVGARLATRLVAGQCAVLLSHPLLPRAGDAFARAFEDADLPLGVVTLLHGDTNEPLEASCAAPQLVFARLKERDERLETSVARCAARPHVQVAAWRVANATAIVRQSDDVRARAAEVIDRCLGRSSTLSAQFPGQIARVLCHQRNFSRFSEELLACLESSTDAQRPVAPLEPYLAEHVTDAWSLGLDEGATPIFGAVPQDRRDEDDTSPPYAIGAPPSSARGGVRPIVFTNVDPRSGLALLTRPAPLLGLVRTSSDEQALELQHELDGLPTLSPRAHA